MKDSSETHLLRLTGFDGFIIHECDKICIAISFDFNNPTKFAGVVPNIDLYVVAHLQM